MTVLSGTSPPKLIAVLQAGVVLAPARLLPPVPREQTRELFLLSLLFLQAFVAELDSEEVCDDEDGENGYDYDCDLFETRSATHSITCMRVGAL
jgi:hypothetical protein